MNPTVEIDPEFLHLTIPISDAKRKELKRSITTSGCLDPVKIWNGIIIDGYKRYDICTRAKIEFQITDLEFPSRDEAIIWVCRERVGDSDPGSAINKYLIGKHYQSAKRIGRLQKKNKTGVYMEPREMINGRPVRVSDTLAEIYHINHVTVEKYGVFANMMDEIAVKSEEFFISMMNEIIHASHNTIIQVAKWDSKRINSFLKQSIIHEESKFRHKFARAGKTEIEEQADYPKKDHPEIPLSVGIKNMPAYDPDMELRILALTIPTWINSLDKAVAKTKMELVSLTTKKQLRDSLQRLEWQILLTQEAVEK